MSGRLQKLKNKGKVQLGNPKSDRGRLREVFITKFKSQFKWGFAKVVVSRAGSLREWSQGEIPLYLQSTLRSHATLWKMHVLRDGPKYYFYRDNSSDCNPLTFLVLKVNCSQHSESSGPSGLPPALNSPVIHLGGERHCTSKLPCARTQCNFPRPRLSRGPLHHEATAATITVETLLISLNCPQKYPK